MATVIIPEIRGGYKATWTSAGKPYHRRLTGIHRNEAIIAIGNVFDGIMAKKDGGAEDAHQEEECES